MRREEELAEPRFATSKLLSPWLPEIHPGYRHRSRSTRVFLLLSCSVTAMVVLLVNLSCTIYFKVNWGSKVDINTFYQGNCSRSENINTGLHVVINLLSTTLLGASNMCMQLLAAPTRSEIDIAHKSRVWLDIGVPSIRNLKYIHKERLIVWMILGLSSIPLHFLYVFNPIPIILTFLI